MSFLVFHAACGGVYDEVSPPEKRRVDVVLVPGSVRLDEGSRQVDAFVDVPAQDTFVTEISFGEGIVVVAFDAESGCVPGVLPPDDFENDVPVHLCLSLAVDIGADAGEREVTFELRSVGEPLIGRTEFVVLPPLQ